MTTEEKEKKIFNAICSFADTNGEIQQNFSYTQLARKVGLSSSTVGKYVRQLTEKGLLFREVQSKKLKLNPNTLNPSSSFFNPNLSKLYNVLVRHYDPQGNHLISLIELQTETDLSLEEIITGLSFLSDHNFIHYWICCNHIGISEAPLSLDSVHPSLQRLKLLAEDHKGSNGEQIIATLLKEHDITYIQEKTFKDFRYKDTGGIPRYDFYLPDYNILIEYDGEQHFKPVEIWEGEQGLQKQKERDNIKNEYAINHGYILIRVPYYNLEYIDFQSLQCWLNLKEPGVYEA